MDQDENNSINDSFNDQFLFLPDCYLNVFSPINLESEKKEYSKTSGFLFGNPPEFSNLSNLSLSEVTNDILNQINTITNERGIIFETKKKNLRGRKRRIKKEEVHDKYWLDNIKRKILIHSINSLIQYTNLVIYRLGYNEKFYKIKAKYKLKEKKDEIKSIKKMNIGQILCQELSSKYKNIVKNMNMIVFEKIKNEPIISNLLSESYSNFIKDIYCKYEKIINLGRYGLNENIYINSKIEMYMDLINKNKNDKRYVEKIKECFNRWFLN